MSAACPCAGRLDDDRRSGRAHDGDEVGPIDLPSPMLACRSAPESNASRESLAWTRSIRPVIALTRPSTMSAQVLAPGVGVAGVEAEADPHYADRLPQPGERVEPARHALSPPAVFSIRIGTRPADPLGELAPVVEADLHVVDRGT